MRITTALPRLTAAAVVCGAVVTGALTAPAALAAGTKTLYVSAGASSDPACPNASKANPFKTIAAALACSRSGDTIQIGAGSFPAGVTIARSVGLVGSGLGTVLTAGASGTPVITDAPGTSVKLSDLTVNGAGALAAGVQASNGVLSVTAVTIENAENDGHDGGGIQVAPSAGSAAVTVSNSTFAHDIALVGGGGIYVGSANGQPTSTLKVTNSTFSDDYGLSGGILIGNAASTVLNSTFDDASTPGSTFSAVDVDNAGSLALGNDLIDTVPGEYSCGDATGRVTDLGNNLLSVPGVNGCATAIVNGANGDQVGTTTQPINPLLGALGANGGLTQTEALQAGSPAIGTAGTTLCKAAPVNNLDQRGKTRDNATRNACDIGAYDTGGAQK